MKGIFRFLALVMLTLFGMVLPPQQGVLASREYRRDHPGEFAQARPNPVRLFALQARISIENALALVPYFERARAEIRANLIRQALEWGVPLNGYTFQRMQQAYAVVLRSSIDAIDKAGGVSTDTAEIYITQRFVNPSIGVSGLGTNVTITLGANATASSSPVTLNLTGNPLSEAMQAGDVIETAEGVFLEVNANAASGATSLQVKKLPVALNSGAVLTFKKWVAPAVRGEIPNMAGTPRTASQDTNVGQLTVLSGETDQQQNLEVFDAIGSPFVNALDRASRDQSAYLAYTLALPAIGGGERQVLTGFMQVGPGNHPLGVNQIARYVFPVTRYGKPVHVERQ